MEASDVLRRQTIFIDDTPGVTMSDVRARARRLKAMAPNPRHSIVFPGFQVAGTRGAKMVEHSGHMVPEGGYNMIPKYVFDGCLIAGETAGSGETLRHG